MTNSTEVPPIVAAACDRAQRLGFELSCEPGVGRLLAALACATPPGSRVLEVGTGAGVGLAWLVHGLEGREDVELISVDLDRELSDRIRAEPWPRPVRFECADGARYVDSAGSFDLIFADAPGGKIENLEGTIAALEPSGVLVVDDMDLSLHEDDEELRDALAEVGKRLLSDPRLVVVPLDTSSGIIVCARRP